jgi:hypothetical protein
MSNKNKNKNNSFNPNLKDIVKNEINNNVSSIIEKTVLETLNKISNNKIENNNINIDSSKQEAQQEFDTKKGVIGIAHTGTFPWQTTMSLLSLQRPASTTIKYHLVGSCLVYDARDKIIEFALKEEADWVMFVDSDMVLPNNILTRFTNLILEGKQVEMISGMAFKRIPPFQPCFYSKAYIDPETRKPVLESPIKFPDKGLIRCEGLGMACTYIDMNVIKRMKQAQEESGQEANYFFPFPGVGEDLTFCLRARKYAKVEMFTDLEISVGHVGEMVATKEHFFAARDAHEKSGNNEPLFKP